MTESTRCRSGVRGDALFAVKMRRGVISIEHADHNSKKTTDLGHGFFSDDQTLARRVER